ncbi:MAG: histidine--tRNA ligase [Kiloniellales bacterium]
MSLRIQPISGFPEFLPEQQIAINRAVDVIRATYESFGFVPIETPAVERTEVLLAKGIAEKEVYGLRRVQEDGAEDSARELALRFDLTVPLARYVAQHYGKLRFPFRRYQIQPVWRGERAQAGRYRQFVQCDIDVIGDEALSLEYDAEIPAVIFQLFRRLGIGKFTIRINNRKILTGLFQSVGLADDVAVRAALNVVDDLEKIGAGKVLHKLGELGLAAEQAERILHFFDTKGSNDEILTQLKAMEVNAAFAEGVAELEAVVRSAPDHVLPRLDDGELVDVTDERALFPDYFKIDLSIARGLDYYTGTVYETRLDDFPQVGSICSGGRYDDLVGTFVDKTFPGVGISIGLTRLMSRLFDAGIVTPEAAAIAPVLVTVQDRSALPAYKELAARLRRAGIATEVFLDDRKLKAQLRYADRRGFPIVIIASPEELEAGQVVVKNMRYNQEDRVAIAQIGPVVRSLIPVGFE